MFDNLLKRRDFLKLLSLMPAAYYLPGKAQAASINQEKAQQNIIILVNDAWSASNVSLYGYPRQTTPNLEKLAEKAIVFHNHYSGGQWTYPATSTLLTGVHPWTHRAFSPEGKQLLKTFHRHNLFGLFDSYHRIAYSHNHFADNILHKMIVTLDEYKPLPDLYIFNPLWLPRFFGTDYDIAATSWSRIIKKMDDGYANSIFLSRLYTSYTNRYHEKMQQVADNSSLVDNDGAYYRPSDGFDWIIEKSQQLAQPFLGYFHFLPPHAPYSPSAKEKDHFANDGYLPIKKPFHPLSSKTPYEELNRQRQAYDEYILRVDSEINRLYQTLAENGTLENTWLIVTSDHGEMFERGIRGHLASTFHNPLAHIPLMIFPPGQQERIDIHTPTSAIDLIPTLLQITGQPIPDWLEGQVLPPFNSSPDPNRMIFAMDARYTATHENPITNGAVMLRRGDYKYTYMFGDHKRHNNLVGNLRYELYNLANDPEEMDNLIEKEPKLAQELQDIIMYELSRQHKTPD